MLTSEEHGAKRQERKCCKWQMANGVSHTKTHWPYGMTDTAKLNLISMKLLWNADEPCLMCPSIPCYGYRMRRMWYMQMHSNLSPLSFSLYLRKCAIAVKYIDIRILLDFIICYLCIRSAWLLQVFLIFTLCTWMPCLM